VAKGDEDKEIPKFWDMLAFFIFRIVDSGLAPWALVALFLLGGLWIVMGFPRFSGHAGEGAIGMF
jgi:hypothetical protein